MPSYSISSVTPYQSSRQLQWQVSDLHRELHNFILSSSNPRRFQVEPERILTHTQLCLCVCVRARTMSNSSDYDDDGVNKNHYRFLSTYARQALCKVLYRHPSVSPPFSACHSSVPCGILGFL